MNFIGYSLHLKKEEICRKVGDVLFPREYNVLLSNAVENVEKSE